MSSRSCQRAASASHAPRSHRSVLLLLQEPLGNLAGRTVEHALQEAQVRLLERLQLPGGGVAPFPDDVRELARPRQRAAEAAAQARQASGMCRTAVQPGAARAVTFCAPVKVDVCERLSALPGLLHAQVCQSGLRVVALDRPALSAWSASQRDA